LEFACQVIKRVASLSGSQECAATLPDFLIKVSLVTISCWAVVDFLFRAGIHVPVKFRGCLLVKAEAAAQVSVEILISIANDELTLT
jgi:hypothetical protein